MSANTKSKRSRMIHIALAVFIAVYLAVYAASIIWTMGYQPSRYWVCFQSGSLQVGNHPQSLYDDFIAKGYMRTGWGFFQEANPPSIERWPGYSINPSFRVLVIPLWLPLVPLLALAALLIYRDRTRPVPGFCSKCGYNLTGNTSGICPECGTIVTQASMS